MFVIVSYDISKDKRRTKIHNILKSYGQWVQYSIFECDLTQAQYAKLRSRLDKLIEAEDSIRFYFLCACCQGKIERIGGEMPRDNTIFFAECAPNFGGTKFRETTGADG
ncbi:MAG: CRISPR-associated endonuclease Cas2 [Cyanophyceae cyanobacterium]